MRLSNSCGRRALLASIMLCTAAIAAAEEPVRLTHDGRLKRDPIYWPDGQSIVYTVEQPSGRMKLVRLNLRLCRKTLTL